jgi:hypothetical protein
MGTIMVLLMAAVVILLLLEAFKVAVPRISFGWLGLALWALYVVIITVRH